MDFEGPRCETCRFYFEDEAGRMCRRLPPTPILMPIAIHPDKPPEFQIKSFFPPMLPSGWCGEHQVQGDK